MANSVDPKEQSDLILPCLLDMLVWKLKTITAFRKLWKSITNMLQICSFSYGQYSFLRDFEAEVILCNKFMLDIKLQIGETWYIIKGSSRIKREVVGRHFFLNPTTHQLEFLLTPTTHVFEKR